MKTKAIARPIKSKPAPPRRKPARAKLHPVIRMLRKWRKEKVADPEKEMQEWLDLKKGIEENRLSERKRFGD